MRTPKWFYAVMMGIVVAGCDSDSTGPDGEAEVVGSVQSSAAPAPGGMGPQMQTTAQASTVVIGEVTSSGTFLAIAEADVESDGDYRIEEVPAGRENLVVRAESASGAVVGSAVLYEETEGGETHYVQPINARSTVHADVWMETRSTSGSNSGMGAAELALFLDASAAASSGATQSQIEALAQASIQAQQAITAAFAAQGVSLSATERNEILVSAAAERDATRDAGSGANVTQQAFVTAAIDAYVEEEVKAETLAMAYAAAATVFARASAGVSSTTHLEVVREAVLLNLAIRKSGAAAVQGDPLGLKASTTLTLNAIDARVRAATSISQLRDAVEEERDLIENRIVLAVFASLPVLGGTVEALVDSRLRTALDASQLWVRLDGAATASAMGTAVGNNASATASASADLVAAIPSSAGTFSASVLTSLLLNLGGGASLD